MFDSETLAIMPMLLIFSEIIQIIDNNRYLKYNDDMFQSMMIDEINLYTKLSYFSNLVSIGLLALISVNKFLLNCLPVTLMIF